MQRETVRHRRRWGPALSIAALTLLGSAFIGGALSVAQAGPDAPFERGKARPWYNIDALRALAGSRGQDVSKLSGPQWALFHHPHEAGVQQPAVGGSRLAKPLGSTTSQEALLRDQWSPAVNWMVDGQPGYVLHTALLPDGRVSFVAPSTTFTMEPTPAGLPVPAYHAGAAQDPPLEFRVPLFDGQWRISDTLFCAAQTFTSDGELFTASGSRILRNMLDGTQYILGLNDAMTNDGSGWASQPGMLGRGVLPEPMRWYPTTTRLADRSILVTAGFELVRPIITKNLSAETFRPSTQTWSLTTPPGALPESLFSYVYTHVFQLPLPTPRGEVLAFGDAGVPGYMSASGTWSESSAVRPGSLGIDIGFSNKGTSSLLPLRAKNGEWGYNNGSVLMAGGQTTSTHASQIDVYDPVADAWTLRRDMGRVRAHPASVLLPDGRILLLGGEDYAGSAGLGRAQYVDPRENFSVQWGTEEYPEVRGYHNVAVLLPDGRVLFGSGNENYTRGELPSFRYYSPSYMFGPRPVISAAPSTLGLGGYGWVAWEGATPPSEVVLMGLGAMTHSFDMNQRYVELPIVASGVNQGMNYSIFRTPAGARVAPPGPYMLFILDENHVPSAAKMVSVQ